eukprot:TRINITY_DN38501_c0_g1_i1.p1 TRINITY_DN38501_c0_g1~~TRINITY_DN38501_c0_g1_i1.p1  ORF type:complete len:330 (+),score=65.62 TRINITY_DN38501_c0_g1_i1:69-1058(+)
MTVDFSICWTSTEKQVRTRRLGGLLTDFVSFPAKQQSSSPLLLLFLPGNPGIVDFYVDFLEALHDTLGSDAIVLGVGHPGHSIRTATGTRFSLEEQIEHKLRVLEDLRVEVLQKAQHTAGPVKVILAGHSIGAYMCLKVAEKLLHSRDIALQHVFGLCPTLTRMAESPNGQKLSGYLGSSVYLNLAGSTTWMISCLPTAWQQSAAAWLLGDSDATSHVDATMQLLDASCVDNVLTLAAQELRDVCGTEGVEAAMTALADRACLIFSSKDEWVPQPFFDELRLAFATSRFIWETDSKVEHAFELSEHATRLMVKHVVSILDEQARLSEGG